VALESALPWLSLAAAAGAGAAIGGRRPRLERWLRAGAFGALALFAYFRWIAPAQIPLALTLETIGQAMLPPDASRWRRPAAMFPAAGWLVLAHLFWSSGEGRLAVFADAGKAALLLALLAAAGLGLRRVLPNMLPPRAGLAAAAGALVLMAAMALTLDWGLWPALVGAAAIFVSQALAVADPPRLQRGRIGWRSAWALDYAGYAAVAYAFLR
jgi:hypothetical protein